MVEKMFLKNMDIPYGVLHDQKLLSVKQENNNLIFTFEVVNFNEEYQFDFIVFASMLLTLSKNKIRNLLISVDKKR